MGLGFPLSKTGDPKDKRLANEIIHGGLMAELFTGELLAPLSHFLSCPHLRFCEKLCGVPPSGLHAADELWLLRQLNSALMCTRRWLLHKRRVHLVEHTCLRQL